ncbi:MAG TPA: hydantoinase/oxoprolinase family protein [Steroidobacteraceae bacterium]|nr:hydantoinase/oxoprolinase family protein [Steroidobacteraceae bacterium]
MFRIGVDVGGTNTDAVVMDHRDVLAVVKVPTTQNVTDGLIDALEQVLRAASVEPSQVELVVIGTTHFTNAVIERRHLAPTAIVRLCLPAAQSLMPMADWPADLCTAVGEHVYLASGGVEFDGTPIRPLDPAEIARIGADIRARGIDTIAVAGVFSPVRDDFERQAGELLAAACPGASITLSSSIGQLGLLERESASILNASLLSLAKRTVASLRQGVARCGLRCPMFLSQNDGTMMDAGTAECYPVLTFASGPTNSMRGAAFLSGKPEAIVLDIGGTTTDVGLLHLGFPRQASTTVDVGGVRTNFRMPDVFSIGLGGGSLVQNAETRPQVGPRSVGYEITRRARVFGGDTLTATDVAVAAGKADIGDRARVADLDAALVRRVLGAIEAKLSAAVERVRTSPDPVPVIAVGGGSILMPDTLAGLQVIRPPYFGAANAIGAAIAQTSGEVDRIYSLDAMTREAALADAEGEARRKATAAGALADTITVTEREDVPLAYLRGNATRVRVKVVGEMGTPRP